MRRYYITKYAMTSGIQEVEGQEVGHGMVSISNGGYTQYFHAGEWHISITSAIEKAEELKAKKIATLNRQLERAQDVVFTAPDAALVPVYPGPDLKRGDIVYTPSGRRAEVYNIDEDKGTFTSQGQFCASVLRREKTTADAEEK